MANMPLNNINAQSQGLLMNALSALSGAEISTLGATKIAELINKINLDFTLVPDSKVLDIIKNIPAETFSQLDSSKVASIINTLPDADLKALPLTVKNSLIFSLSVPDFLSVSLPNLYTNEERLVNMANMPLDNINAQSQVLLMSALEALSGAEIATLGATKVAELINKINLDFTTVPEAKVLDIVAHLPSDTFNHIEQDKLISIANRLTAQNVQTLAFTTQRTIRSLIDPEGLEAEIKTTSIAIASTVQSSHQSANSVTPKNVAVDQPKIDSIITKIPTTGMVSANHVAGIGGYSGGLAFVETVPELIPTNDTKNTVTRSTITNTDRSGIDPSGFMKVFVVNGGINLPIQINPTTDAIINNN
jgi:hypothetical protein